MWTPEAGLFAIQQASAAGFDLLEILLPPSMEFDAPIVKRQLKQHGLKATCSLNLPKEAHIPFYPKKATCLIKEALDKASELEVDYLGGVLHSGIGVFSGKQRTQEEENTLCEVWAEVAEYAARSGITIGIEPINRYESYMCTSAEEVLRFIKCVNAPNLSLHLDTFHMNIEETSFYEPVIAAGSRLRHIHMTESDRGMLGEGNVRWDDLFRGLQEIDFNGNLVLENFSNSVPGMAEAVSLWRPSKYNADALAKGSLAFMRKMARKYQ
jgi:D-psicose/D-tagatose/L-ribulose 3-epimerase